MLLQAGFKPLGADRWPGRPWRAKLRIFPSAVLHKALANSSARSMLVRRMALHRRGTSATSNAKRRHLKTFKRRSAIAKRNRPALRHRLHHHLAHKWTAACEKMETAALSLMRPFRGVLASFQVWEWRARFSQHLRQENHRCYQPLYLHRQQQGLRSAL